MIGVGIIGAGHFGAAHARALAALPDARLVAACRNDAAGLAAFVAAHGGTPHLHWQALLDDPRVDAVVIATPHHLHRDVAIAALQAGKHVLLEKPMAQTLADCDAILDAAARAAGQLMIGHVTRYFRPMLAAADLLESGRIGTPVIGHSAFVKLWMEGNRQPWHLTTATGGGMLMTAGIHALDRLVHLMGAPVASVSAMIATQFHDQQADDTALLNLRFADGRLGHVTSLGYRDGAVTNDLHLTCTDGTLSLDLSGRLRIGQGGRWQDLPCGEENDPLSSALQRQWQAFLAAIAQGQAPPVSGAYGRHLMAIILAATRSSDLRRAVAVA